MAWHQISITSIKSNASKISDLFSELGAVSVTYMDAEDKPVYEPLPGETKIWDLTKVIALFELDAEPEIVKTVLFSQFDNKTLQDWSVELIEDQLWERAWMEHYQPMKFSDKLWVCPTDQEISEPGTICLTLDPGLAFGTGTHATTALCLEWLASHDLSNKIVIDYGCGSGILAVAALLLGAKQAHAIDIDPQAITATLENARKNQVEDRIQCYLPEQFQPFEADVVIANILATPLCDLSASISALLKPAANLILSGILNEQADKVSQAYLQQDINMQTATPQGDWCRLQGTKNN